MLNIFPQASLVISKYIFFGKKRLFIFSAAADASLQSCPTVRPQRWQPTRLRHPRDSPGKNTGGGCHFLLQCMKMKGESEVTQSCPTVCDPMDRSLPGSSVYGIFQARGLEWGAIAFSAVDSYFSINLHDFLPHLSHIAIQSPEKVFRGHLFKNCQT